MSKLRVRMENRVKLVTPTLHRDLLELEYENSGHIGFASEKMLSDTKDNLNLKIDTNKTELDNKDKEIEEKLNLNKTELDNKINSNKTNVDNTLTAHDNRITNAQTTANEAKSIAEGKSKGKVFNTFEEMKNNLKAASSTEYHISDNLYIKDVNVPDYWISNVLSTNVGEYGYYEISELEGRKIDLSEYQKITDNTLNTTTKNIPGAINEVNKNINDEITRATNKENSLDSKIDSQTSEERIKNLASSVVSSLLQNYVSTNTFNSTLANYLNKTSDLEQEINSKIVFKRPITIVGQLWDKEASQGTAGQILSSTGNGVVWIDTPSGGGSGGDLSNYVDLTSDQEIAGRKIFIGNICLAKQLWDKHASQGEVGNVLVSTGDGVEWRAPSGGGSGNLTFDDEPTENSGNPVTSNGIWVALENKANVSDIPSVGKTFETVTMGGTTGATLDVNKVYSVIRCHQRVHDGVYFNIKNGDKCLEVGKVYNLKIMEFEIRDDQTIKEDGELDLNTYFRVQFENARYTPLNFMPYIYVNSGSEILSDSRFVGLTEGTISNLEIDIVVESETSIKAYVIRPLSAE